MPKVVRKTLQLPFRSIDLADRWLNLRRTELTVYPDNGVGVTLYKKFGFEIEGTLRKARVL